MEAMTTGIPQGVKAQRKEALPPRRGLASAGRGVVLGAANTHFPTARVCRAVGPWAVPGTAPGPGSSVA